jgi:hypothetical protein
LEAELSISYKTVREAEAVAEAISPDNLRVPSGLFIKTMRQGSRVVTQIVCNVKLETFISTVNDLLSAVSVAERALSAVETRWKRRL